MATASTAFDLSPSLIVLGNGQAVPIDALRVLWQLEIRGLTIRLDGDGGLLVGPRRSLSEADRAAIRRHRDELIALVRYVEVM
jgi:hypothetical protein